MPFGYDPDALQARREAARRLANARWKSVASGDEDEAAVGAMTGQRLLLGSAQACRALPSQGEEKQMR